MGSSSTTTSTAASPGTTQPRHTAALPVAPVVGMDGEDGGVEVVGEGQEAEEDLQEVVEEAAMEEEVRMATKRARR